MTTERIGEEIVDLLAPSFLLFPREEVPFFFLSLFLTAAMTAESHDG